MYKMKKKVQIFVVTMCKHVQWYDETNSRPKRLSFCLIYSPVHGVDKKLPFVILSLLFYQSYVFMRLILYLHACTSRLLFIIIYSTINQRVLLCVILYYTFFVVSRGQNKDMVIFYHHILLMKKEINLYFVLLCFVLLWLNPSLCPVVIVVVVVFVFVVVVVVVVLILNRWWK